MFGVRPDEDYIWPPACLRAIRFERLAAASSNVTPCFRTVPAAFGEFHSKSIVSSPCFIRTTFDLGGASIPDADALFVDDPQLPCGSLRGSETDSSQYQRENRVERLFGRSEHPDAAVTARRVGSAIREVEIERDKYPVFGDACREKVWIDCASKVLGDCGLDIVTKITQRGFDPSRQVFVQLESKDH